MKIENNDISRKTAAITSGISLLIMTIIAPIANFAILDKLFAADAAATFAIIASSETQFRIAICLFLIVVILDIIIAWGLYIFLKPVNKSLSLLAAWMRIIYAAMLGTSTYYLVEIIPSLKVANSPENALAYQSLISFSSTWEFSLIVFSIHLLIIGYLFIKAGYMKRILGILLVIAAFGYMADGFGKILSDSYSLNLAVFTFMGEVILIFWLLIIGSSVNE